MIKKVLHSVIVFFLGIIFWQFIPFYFSNQVNEKIWNFSSNVFKTLRVKDMTQPPLDNSLGELPTDECPDIEELITLYEGWLEKFGSKSTDYKEFKPFIIDENQNDVNGVVKWRYNKNEPYYGLSTRGEWEHILDNANIETIVESAETDLILLLEKKGFKVYKPMDIPFYRYPSGLGAKKIGFTKSNTAYLMGLIELDKEELKTRFEEMDFSYDLKKSVHPLAARITCSEITKVEKNKFLQFITLPHTFPNETVIIKDYEKNGLIRFALLYPGASNDYYEYYFMYEKDGKLTKLQTTGEFPLCSVFEAVKMGKGTTCFRPERKEFDVVKY